MNRVFWAVFCCFLFFSPLTSTAGDNPFVSKEPRKTSADLPTHASEIFTKVALWQHKLNNELTRLTKELKTTKSKNALIPLILLAFLYGVIHAAGPGHGKTISFSYFLSGRSQVRKGILLGNLISFLHTFSAVFIVLGIYFIFKKSYLSSFETVSQKLKIVSFSLVVLIGLALLISSLLSLRQNHLQKGEADRAISWLDHKGILPIAIAVGVVPCPGVVIIMLFSLSQDLLAIGLMLSFFMALGMGMTISFAGVLSIVGQEGVLKCFSGRNKARIYGQRALSVLGSLLIVLFGMILLLGAI
ncbi:MAG: hypothetical protein JW883_06090 [Deltaproteobacteria bacterium]|nr:hypothetical protein [Deltaproteobacteria bacterium]